MKQSLTIICLLLATLWPSKLWAQGPPTSLVGYSIRGDAEYIEFTSSQLKDYFSMMEMNEEKLDAKQNSWKTCNYELETNGPFYITWVTGHDADQHSHILGYYYHSSNTYDDIKYVDLSETNKWDYIDGLAKVQYQLDIDDEVDGFKFKANTWYDANFDMHDTYTDAHPNNPDRVGDNIYNSQAVYDRYKENISGLRGISFKIDLPEGSRVGFYLRSDEEPYPEQWSLLKSKGFNPYVDNQDDYMGSNFSAEFLNIEGNGKGTHRSFIKDYNEVYWMGMESLIEGGDHDCNDVIFGLVADLKIWLPDIVELSSVVPLQEEKCATPTFTHEGNTITIGTVTEGATIYYTLDGTDPTSKSTLYTKPIVITESCTIKAKAIKEGYCDSEVASFSFDLQACDFVSGKYYLQNVANGKFLANGSSKGTHTAVNDYGLEFEIIEVGTNKCIMKIGNRYVGSNKNDKRDAKNIWVDRDIPDTLTFSKTENDKWLISDAIRGNLTNDSLSTVVFTNSNSENAQWRLVTFEERYQALSMATSNAPMDATFLITGVDYKAFWNGNPNIIWKDSLYASTSMGVFEVFNSGDDINEPYNVYQKLKVKNGRYKLTTQGFYRAKYQYHFLIEGEQETLDAFLYANNKTIPLMSIHEEDFKLEEYMREYWGQIHSFPYSSVEAMDFFNAGLYVNILDDIIVNNEELIIGVKDDKVIQHGCWISYSNYRLTYYGYEKTVAKPSFSREGNFLTIMTATDGAIIYYTLDGTTPTMSSIKYTAPIELPQSCTVKAIAIADGYQPSEVASFDLEIIPSVPEPYAVLRNNNSVLKFFYDDQKEARGGMGVGPFTYNNSCVNSSWYEYRETITDIEFDASYANCTSITSTAYWFYECYNLTTITGVENLKTDNVMNMNYMFMGCSDLTSLDISGFKTDNVTDMNYMFSGCSSLTTIYAGDNWSIEKVETGDNMFTGCTRLVGGKGTAYNADHVDYTYAHIDDGATNPGYFTDKNAPAVQDITVTLKDKNDNYWYDITGTDYSGYEAIKWVLPAPRMGVVNPDFSMNMLNVFIGNKLSFTVNGNAQPEDISGEFAFASSDQFISPNGDVLIYDDGNTQTEIAKLNPVTGEISLVNTAVTRRLLNEDIISLKLPLRVRAFYKGQEVTVTNGDFTILVVRPINAEGISSQSLFDSQAFSIDMIDLVSLTDWRNVSFVAELEPSVPDFYAYYNVKTITITGATDSNTASDIITTNLSGTVKSLRQSSNMLQLAYEPTDLTTINYRDSYGTLSLTNYGANLSTFSLYIPLTVTYEWGSLETTAEIHFGSPTIATAATPSFTRNGNTLTIASTTEGATIYYTLDGTDPTTESTLYTDPITLTQNCAVKAIAVADGYMDSKVASYIVDWFGESGPEPYAVLSDDGKTVTFYYDDQKAARGGIDINDKTNYNGPPYATATTAVFDVSFANYLPTSTACWFMSCFSLETITGVENLKTDNVTNMGAMFFYCTGLKNLDVSGFKTDNVTDMTYMFGLCSSLSSLDVSGFKTDNVTSMFGMFHGCSGLKSLDVSGFNTSNVTTMQGMFRDCSGLTNLYVSHFDTQNVTSMGYMFYRCSGLSSLDLSSFNTSKIELYDGNNSYAIANMFFGCSNLTTIYVGDGWTTANLTESPGVFELCTRLVGGKGTKYDANHTDYTYAHIDGGTSNPGYFTDKNAPAVVTEAEPYAVLSDNNTVLTFYYDDQKEVRGGMGIGPFEGWPYFQTWYEQTQTITDVVFDTSFANCTSITSTAYWFCYCENLTTITGIENLNTANVTDMTSMFTGCYSLPHVDLRNFNTANVTNMHEMFDWCQNLKELDVSHFNTSNVTDMEGMFAGCTSLTNLDLSNFNTGKVTNMSFMFYSSWALKSLDLSNFNTDNVAKMDSMFNSCSSLISINMSRFNTANVASMKDIFLDCPSLASIEAGSANIPAEEYTHIGNPNLLVYVNEPSLAPEGIQNVIINGVASEIILNDPSDPEAPGNYNFFCPTAFMANKISYSHTYNQQSGIDGECRGWETIALPFTVQTITHRVKGIIAPFGAQGLQIPENVLRFWLCELGRTRFENATTIEANKPYIISMPQNPEYLPQYNLGQDVITFAATNTTVPATVPQSATAGQRTIHANFTVQPAADRIYTMNVSAPYEGHVEGSVFVPGLRTMRPFEAYTTSANGARYIELFDEDANGICDLQMDNLRLDSNVLYDLNGRRVKEVNRSILPHKQLVIKNRKVQVAQ